MIVSSTLRLMGKPTPTVKTALFLILLIGLIPGCSSALSNSESFYRDIPRRPINWREYLTD
jgi:hypothetical protein